MNAVIKKRRKKSYYREGQRAYQANKRWRDCPYKHGTPKWQEWFNGWSDESDKDFIKLIKVYPNLLIGS